MKLPRIDVDTLLVFFLLAVTVAQMGHYLASYAPGWMKSLGYLQAAAFDAAIWRSSWWYKRDRSEKRRRVSLLGVLVFSAMSAFFNYGYYTLRAPTLPGWHRALMATVLPAGVALLSYLAAQHEPAPVKAERTEREPAKNEPQAPPQLPEPAAIEEPARVTFADFAATHPRLLEMTGKQIAQLAGVSERTGNNWKQVAKQQAESGKVAAS